MITRTCSVVFNWSATKALKGVLTCKEEATEEDNGCRIYCPYHLTLVDWVDMVDLYAHITSRTRTVEDVQFYLLACHQCNIWLVDTCTEVSLGDLAQCGKTRLECLLVAEKFHLKVGCQR